LFLSVLFLWIIFCVEAYNTERQLLTDIKALTFNSNKKTTGRRSKPIEQLNCVGGSAYGSSQYYPSVVQCINVGHDGFNVEWECKADLDDAVKFGSINVNCEGYDDPNDPYILKGSCSLEYNLEHTRKGATGQRYFNDFSYDSNSGSGWGSFITFIILVFVIYNIFRACANSQQAAYQAPAAGGPGYGGPGYGGPGYGGGPGGYGGYGGPGYGPGCAPTYGASPMAGGGGFWTGLATGGLLSHLFRPSYGYGYRRPGWGGGFGGNSYGGGGSGFFGSSGGGGSRMSSGFGGSSRR